MSPDKPFYCWKRVYKSFVNSVAPDQRLLKEPSDQGLLVCHILILRREHPQYVDINSAYFKIGTVHFKSVLIGLNSYVGFKVDRSVNMASVGWILMNRHGFYKATWIKILLKTRKLNMIYLILLYCHCTQICSACVTFHVLQADRVWLQWQWHWMTYLRVKVWVLAWSRLKLFLESQARRMIVCVWFALWSWAAKEYSKPIETHTRTLNSLAYCQRCERLKNGSHLLPFW